MTHVRKHIALGTLVTLLVTLALALFVFPSFSVVIVIIFALGSSTLVCLLAALSFYNRMEHHE